MTTALTVPSVSGDFEPVLDIEPNLAASDCEESVPYRLTVPLLLAAGWGALLTFSVVFLIEDGRDGSASAAPERTALLEKAPHTPPSIVTGETPRPSWSETDPPPVAETAPARIVKTVIVTPPPTSAPPAQAPGGVGADKIDFVGVWGPTTHACAERSRRRGYIPATITEDGATAGHTQCRFRNGRRDGVAWTAAADCSERGRHWTSQVRLVVDGDRLTWTSGKGNSFYVRCGRRDD